MVNVLLNQESKLIYKLRYAKLVGEKVVVYA